MSKRIDIVGKQAERIQDIGATLPRIEPEQFAAALGAEPCGERLPGALDPIALAELGSALLKQLRSTGGRPGLEGATERCKVPLAPEDVAALEQIIAAIERQTGAKPSLGQLTSVIVRTHLDLLRTSTPAAQPEAVRAAEPHAELALSLQAIERLVEERLQPIREDVNRLKEVVAARDPR